MAYAVVEDFRGGVDRRSPRSVGIPGTLWVGANCHITTGGRIEKRRKLVEKYSLTSGKTWGMKGAKGSPYVFGYESAGSLSPPIPAGVVYQQLVHPGVPGTAIDDVLDVISLGGKQYVIVRFIDGQIHHYYDGARVTAWDDGVMTTFRSSLDAMAAHLAALLNMSSVVTASAVGAVITITNRVTNVTTAISALAENGGGVNDQTAVVVVTTPASSGVAQVATVTLGGTAEIGDRFAVTVGGIEYGAGNNPQTKATFGIALGAKLYLIAGSTVVFCSVNDPTKWRATILGAGFFIVQSNGKGSEDIVSVSEYQGGLAFYCPSYIQTWSISEDDELNKVQHTVDNTGAKAMRGTTNAGNIDSYYLSAAGIRSLRQQTVNGTPFSNHVGDPINPLIKDDMRALTSSQIAKCRAGVNPTDSRVWFWMGTRVYVLSYFPQSKVTAWSWYDIGIEPGWMDVISERLYLRSGDKIYVYGGDDGETYDADASDLYHVDVECPFMHAGRIADDKTAMSYNVGAEGTWDVFMKSSPKDPSVETALGTVDFFTYAEPAYAMAIESTHFAPRFRTSEPGPAMIVNFAFDFERT